MQVQLVQSVQPMLRCVFFPFLLFLLIDLMTVVISYISSQCSNLHIRAFYKCQCFSFFLSKGKEDEACRKIRNCVNDVKELIFSFVKCFHDCTTEVPEANTFCA